ncbi:Lysophospholipase L1 [Mucilaginibacter pineti]|uniref:Lysophospholipase L1 n=1 Tax=Mucilaginibacter pineti TaxID=1391627 RepID=A0A1G6X006_9SPHI|nr:SGNH/GDSL hydrolase family protein [Mucilaginibacter pineti]SDD71502.1 Lysophospholipase L1 [Mucilaginibacter pineti]
MKYIKHIKLFILLIVAHLSAYTQVKSDTTQNKATENEAQNEEYKLHNDWPNLNYYQNDNIKVNAQRNSGNRVVFMGNSITELWAEIHPEFFRKHKNFIDRGISGQTTPQMLLRFRQDVIDLKPKMVVILGGTNDIAGNTGPATLTQIFGNLVSMAQLAKANHIKVIISSILPVYDYPWNKGKEPALKIIRLNNLLKAYAKAHDLIYVDYHTAMKDQRNGLRQELTADGVHPNKNGYLIMEKLLENKL